MSDQSTTLTMRDARRDDVPMIVHLLMDDALGRTREVYGDALDPAYLKAFDAIAEDPNNRLIVADLEGEVVGCMQITTIPHLTFTGGTRLQIEGVRVKESVRGRRVGAAMIEWAARFAEIENCHLVQLTCNKARDDARRFYEDQGFEPTHIGYKRYLV